MKLSLLLFILHLKLRKAAKTNKAFQSHIGTVKLRISIKTADGKRGRTFIFDKGSVSSTRSISAPCDAALVWSDPGTAFRVMSSGSDEQSFLAAAQGKMKIEGMAFYIQWFTDGVKLAMK